MADGPRRDKAGDPSLCEATRAVIEEVDWPCEVKTLFHSENKGCGKAVASGIDWFFDHEEQGIILEDDCLPDASFFRFCEELLDWYRDDTRVMHINGNNYDMRDFFRDGASYCFGSYPQAWGWATWRRAWKLYDVTASFWPVLRQPDWLKSMGWNMVERRLQILKYDAMYPHQKIDTWDYQWQLSVYSQNGLAIVPKWNLVSNIGFGGAATHTVRRRKECAALPTRPIGFPLKHPTMVLPNPGVDRRYRRIMIGTVITLIRMELRRAASRAANCYYRIRKRTSAA
jgi:hypothetical protein